MTIRHAEVLTARIYKYPQYSYEQLKPLDSTISKSLWAINFWHDDSDANAAKRLERNIQPIASLFPYKPWNKPIFRAIRVSDTSKFTVGKTYVLKTGYSYAQSWTTSAAKAKNFGQDYNLGKGFIVVQLVSSGHELANHDWLMSVALHLSDPAYKDLSVGPAAVSLVNTLKRFKGEDEVIMQLPKLVKVRVVLIDSND